MKGTEKEINYSNSKGSVNILTKSEPTTTMK